MEPIGLQAKRSPCDIEGHKWPQCWQDEKWYALTIAVSHATSLEKKRGGGGERESYQKDVERARLPLVWMVMRYILKEMTREIPRLSRISLQKTVKLAQSVFCTSVRCWIDAVQSTCHDSMERMEAWARRRAEVIGPAWRHEILTPG